MTDETALPVPAESPAVPSTPAQATTAGAPSTPYRSALADEAPVAAAGPREWPVLGLSLWVYGMAMWSFFVMGELATSYTPGRRDFVVSEGIAALFVAAVTLGTLGMGLRRSLASTPARTPVHALLRAVGVALLAFVLWLVVTIFAAAFGDSSPSNVDGRVTVTLALLAAAAAFVGRRLAGLHRHAPTPRQRTVGRALWIGAALASIVALAEVMAGD